jgi:hypothetical protein
MMDFKMPLAGRQLRTRSCLSELIVASRRIGSRCRTENFSHARGDITVVGGRPATQTSGGSTDGAPSFFEADMAKVEAFGTVKAAA